MYTRWAISQVRKHIHVLSIWICAVYTGGGVFPLYSSRATLFRMKKKKNLWLWRISLIRSFFMLNPFVFVMGLFQHSKIYETDPASFFYWRMDVYNADFLVQNRHRIIHSVRKEINISRDFRSIEKKMIFTPRICWWLYTNERVILMSNFLFCSICLFISRIADRTRQRA